MPHDGGGRMIEQERADAFAQAWIDAWNRHDLKAILSHYSDDIEFISPVVVRLLGDHTGTIRGKPALRSYFEKGLATYPNLRFQLEKALPGVKSVTLYYQSINDLVAAEVMEFDAQHCVVRVLAHYTPRS
jgi:hypothetical protein